jgi:2-amino-4-hydroxy-6-hydroxymethyldihydropteridine diphosphokinase
MAKIHINIGSNIDKSNNIKQALKALQEYFGVLETSSIYQTPAEGFAGDDFYNIGVNIQTEFSIDKVNKILDSIEQKLGRDRQKPKFSNRMIDLDLVLYDDVIEKEKNLPRDDILKYIFVLQPLIELNPNQLHPVEKITFEALLIKYKYKKKIQIVSV